MSEDEAPPPEMVEYLRRIGKKYGSQGGEARAKNLSAAQRKRIAQKAADASVAARAKETPEQRKERARKAARARWVKRKTED